MEADDFYRLNRPDEIDSPALLIFPDRIRFNIRKMVELTGTPERLIPHVKTHKMKEVVEMQMQEGINKFKCATIAEAEMLALAGAKEVVMAYQLNFSKAKRFLALTLRYPKTIFHSLVDNLKSAGMLDKLFEEAGLMAQVFIDLDNGMHRTGIPVHEGVIEFYQNLLTFKHLRVQGLHAYDGHIHIQNLKAREHAYKEAFAPVKELADTLEDKFKTSLKVIAGGTPTFPFYAKETEVWCSPGTSLLWDEGYDRLLPEQPFLWAAVLLTRIISKPSEGSLTVDLGHKSVASENPLDKRVRFLNLGNYRLMGQSEEHLVIQVEKSNWETLEIGDPLYGIPYHICPTVALYNEVQVIKNGELYGQWKVTARGRKITL